MLRTIKVDELTVVLNYLVIFFLITIKMCPFDHALKFSCNLWTSQIEQESLIVFVPGVRLGRSCPYEGCSTRGDPYESLAGS